LAGAAASEFSSGVNTGEWHPGEAGPSYSPVDHNGAVKPLEEALKSIITEKAGIIRDAPGLQEALTGINSIKSVLKGLSGKETSVAGERLGMMLDVAGALCLAALARAESRGSHFRTDHPAEKKDQMGNYFVRKINGELDISFMSNAVVVKK